MAPYSPTTTKSFAKLLETAFSVHYSYDHQNSFDQTAQEARLTTLERHVQDLIKWQHSVVTVLSRALTANNNQQTRASPVETAKPVVDVPGTPSAKLSISTKAFDTAKVEQKVEPAVSVKEISLPPTPPTEIVADPAATINSQEILASDVAIRILDVIQGYGQHIKSETETSEQQGLWAGRAKFLPKVELYVNAGQPIKMILPAFPWKSINRVDKVTGALPDLGEELALARLDNLCRDIKEIYQHGAEINIATDGLVFNDLVGISDDDTWEYSVALMNMAASKGYTGIKLVRVMDLLNITPGEETTKEMYMETVEACRKEMEAQFENASEDVRKMIEEDPDTLLTYRGFIRFLETDLKHSEVAKTAKSGRAFRVCVKKIAMGMMMRAESFTKIIQAKCADYVRLSIHPSSGAVKLSIPLIMQSTGGFPKTPWHSSIAVSVDGSYRTVHSKDVRDTHDLIYRHNRPYYYRERSVLYEWDENKFDLEHLYPGGLIVRPKTAAAATEGLTETDLTKLRELARIQPVVKTQGFSNIADGEIAA
ncbi:MAG: hypothetical protein M1836_007486 [Candelina mexicana]|nr:MAG: hypothetical protein M1836_007486 [Candelina mexicana]